MPEKRKRLCALCREARDHELMPAPPHLVHPVSGKPRLYDIHGHAKCPDCGALWHRHRNAAELVE